MRRDYARYQSQSKLAEPGWRKRLLLLVLIMCVSAAIIAGFYVYKSHSAEKQKFMTWIAQLHSSISHKQPLVTKNPSVQQTTQEPEVRFNFYTELPNMQVTLPETEETQPAQTAAAKPPATNEASLSSTNSLPKDKSEPKKPIQYIIQMGVFKNETAAGQLRVSLLLAGFEADIVQNEGENNTILYRVQKGPYPTVSKAKEIQRQLQNKGITGVVKQL